MKSKITHLFERLESRARHVDKMPMLIISICAAFVVGGVILLLMLNKL